MYQRKYRLVGISVLLALCLAACGNTVSDNRANSETTVANNKTEQTITYLGKDYVLPAEIKNIVTASLESMEDAAILGVKPVGVLAIANAMPAYLASEFANAALIGDRFAPSTEAIMKLDPDVILGTSKFGADMTGGLNKIQTMIPYSHLSTNWKDNLLLLGQISGKTPEAEVIIKEYESKSATARIEIQEKLKDHLILVIRIRQGRMYVYPATVYLNPVIYKDLGATVPEVIASTKAQAELSLEALVDINPDYIFLQFEASENTEDVTVLDVLFQNQIFKSVKAAKNDHVFINVINPSAQGGTAWSKVKFLDVAIKNLLYKN